MDNADQFAAAHAEIDGLPISQTLMQRIEKITDADGNVDTDSAIGPIIAAIVALERTLRQG